MSCFLSTLQALGLALGLEHPQNVWCIESCNNDFFFEVDYGGDTVSCVLPAVFPSTIKSVVLLSEWDTWRKRSLLQLLLCPRCAKGEAEEKRQLILAWPV
jgi:hypothetical protein